MVACISTYSDGPPSYSACCFYLHPGSSRQALDRGAGGAAIVLIMASSVRSLELVRVASKRDEGHVALAVVVRSKVRIH